MSRLAARNLVLALSAIVALAAPACTSGVGAAAPRAMNHPVDVAFACFDTSVIGQQRVRPLSDCALYVDVSTNTRRAPDDPTLHMHALVTQSRRGEVGAVDLLARGVLDSDMSVPGYTFVPVGELPTQIIVPPNDSNGVSGDAPTACTYVASRGAVDGRHPGISVIDTRRFRAGAGLEHDPYPLHDPYILPAAPSDMVLAPDASALWITLDSLGVLVRVPFRGPCDLGPIDLVVPLYEDVPAGVPFTPGSSADLTRECGLVADPVLPYVTPPRTPDVDLTTDPEPVAIAIDADNGVLLIADRALPLIHRVNMADGTRRAPLATGVPVRDVVVTPRVPDSYELMPDPADPMAYVPLPTSAITFSRYVYAIDDTDGTVLVMEYSDESAPNFGTVIPVDVQAARRPDRLGMPVVARSLEIITPQYDTSAPDPRFPPPDAETRGNPYGYGLCLPSDPAPTQPPTPLLLRGVFLVVAGADGALRFVDIYDLDAPCRGRAPSTPVGNDDCTNPGVVGDNLVYIRRHRPRVQQLLSSFVTIESGPTVYFPGGGSQVLGTDGLPVGADPTMALTTPALAPFADPDASGEIDAAAAACPGDFGMVWGIAAGQSASGSAALPIVCSLVDPFAAISETWSATFEGQIPGTYTSSANAQVDASGEFNGVIDTRLDYCSLGIIGSGEATAPAGEPEAAYEGDMLAIVGTMPEDRLEADRRCFAVLGISQIGEQQQPIFARIEHAFTSPDMQQEPYIGRLTLSPDTPIENRLPLDGHMPTIADAVRCYGDTLLTIDVHTRGAFAVSGSRSGFQTRVVRGADGRCQYDLTLDPLLQARAYNDVRDAAHTPVVFRNRRIAFRPIGVTTRAQAEIRMILSGGPSQLGIDLALSSSGTRQMALPTGLRYSSEMWALYVLETERSGLIELTLRPLSRATTAYQ